MRETQFGEDIMIREIFKKIGEHNRYFIDIGGGGRWSNTEFLEEEGWIGLRFDKEYGHFITVENLHEVVSFPDKLDFLSIDIDGNDYWIWKAMDCKARVVCIEYDHRALPNWVQDYDPNYEWNNHSIVGAGRQALIDLGKEKGYTFYDETGQTNLFFICDSELLEPATTQESVT